MIDERCTLKNFFDNFQTNFIEKNSEKRSDSVVAIVERAIKPLFSNVSLELKSKSTLAKLKQDVTSLIEQLRGNVIYFY